MIDVPGIRFSSSAERNKDAIAKAILPRLAKHAKILEIASGTGQHGAYMVSQCPDLLWQFSDQDVGALENLQLVQKQFQNRLRPPLCIDVTLPKWEIDLGQFDAIYCSNMIHIAPKAALPGLAKGVGSALKPDGLLFLYGPFLDGRNSKRSNFEFDISLKARNPEWGVKDLQSVKHIFADYGLACGHVLEMPRDNSLLIFRHIEFSG